MLGALNMGAFFALVYVAAQLLRTSVAATIMAVSPVAMMLIAWPLLAERPKPLPLAGAGLGLVGVVLLVASGSGGVNPLGVAASAAAMGLSAFGHVLTKRWGATAHVLSVTSWQLVAGGLVLLVAAVLVEGAPPRVGLPAVLGFGYVSVVATALAFSVWFTGLRHLDAGTVGLLGLLNPVTGVLLGTAVAGEVLTGRQLVGLALVLAGVLLGQPALTRRWAARRAARVAEVSPGSADHPGSSTVDSRVPVE
ncbi:EamA family transporter [Actinosynnema sp. NPDC020468]|uniref:EamA family transporter n=1 Tax=Actinosynnema sp. NPDC020468 TaxID=3154488 RepID=UPI0033DDE09D